MIDLSNRRIWRQHDLKPWPFRSPATFLLTLAFTLTFYLTSFSVSATENNKTALIIYQQTQGFSQQLIEQLERDISSKGYQTRKMIIAVNSGLSPQAINTLHKQQLLITIGSRVTELILKTDIDKPMLSALIPRHIARTLHQTYSTNKNWSSLLIDQPLDRQLNLINAVLGEKTNTGVLLGPFTKDLKEKLNNASSQSIHNIKYIEIHSANELTASLQILSQSVDVLLTLPDPVIYNRKTIRGILLSAYRNKIPIIGFSKAYVKAGAIAAIYSKPAQISKQISILVDEFFKHKKFIKSRYFPDDFSVALNKNIARSLGIKLDSNQAIIQELKMAEKK